MGLRDATLLQDPGNRRQWFQTLPILFCMIAGCRGCDGHGLGKPFRPTQGYTPPKLSQDSLVSWMRFAKYLEQEPAEETASSLKVLLLALRNLFRHATGRGLADFEPRRNSVMQDILIAAYKHDDRRIRIYAA
jgi:hypothetical protein